VLARLQPVIATLPAGAVSLETGHATALGKLLGAGEADLSVRVQADDLDGALQYATRVASVLGREPRLTNVRIGTELGEPEYVASIRHDVASSYGIQASQIANTITNYMLGSHATDFVDFDRRIPVTVRLPPSAARSLATLGAPGVATAPSQPGIAL